MTIDCPYCNGTGQQTIQVHSNNEDFPSSLEMDCGYCNKTGKTTQAKVDASEKATREFWCHCGNPSEDVEQYQYDDGGHGWLCRDCGKVTQVG